VKLLQHSPVGKTELHVAVSRDGNPTTKIEVIGVVVHKLRKKLIPHGVEIICLHGFGYALSEDTRDRVRKIIGEDIISTAAPRGEETLNE
jgi:hypothetical protein